ncbi:CrcB family protein [Citricoccus sp. SGAir0253]|uniref:fluoride efflux transporter FluC n=1 Tax=Citricoccus sp. SGAir0253 TaxID=2567881 RepID=UPI0010CD397A|nr:CrcB family protein [Citricoccus sp. SGAir0253]QCU78450.1 CrcB family protein [Citricoccus sp. SGAir0253]
MSRPGPAPAVVLAVAGGGMAGTLARWLLVEVAPSPAHAPLAGWLALLGVNLAGSFLLGLFNGLAARRPWPRWLAAGLGVGVLGSFTSLSAVLLAAALVAVPGVAPAVMSAAGPGAGAGADPATVVASAGAALGALALGAVLGTAAGWAGLRAGGWPRPERAGGPR